MATKLGIVSIVAGLLLAVFGGISGLMQNYCQEMSGRFTLSTPSVVLRTLAISYSFLSFLADGAYTGLQVPI